MFSKANRYSFRRGVPRNILNTPFFVIRYETGSNKLECAVVVGKKVSKKATERNRIKRKIVAKIRETLEPDRKVRLVVFAKKGLSGENFEEASKNLEDSIKNLV